MAPTDPIGLKPPGPIAAPVASDPHAGTLLASDDVWRVRLYSRMAAGIRAIAAVLLTLPVVWLANLVLDENWGATHTRALLITVGVVATATYLRAELRLRTYRLDLTPDAIIFQYGRKRSYAPREHIQLFDTESGLLLRLFRLRRCNLHTGGGMVIVSPVTARAAVAIERLIHERPALADDDEPHAVA